MWFVCGKYGKVCGFDTEKKAQNYIMENLTEENGYNEEEYYVIYTNNY